MQTKPPICTYCEKEAVLRSSKCIYGSDYGPIWYCLHCGAFVGCHRGTEKPLGLPAKGALRKLRKQTHVAFDLLWKPYRGVAFMSRSKAYSWLAEELGIGKDQCHIGMFMEERCRKALDLAVLANKQRV